MASLWMGDVPPMATEDTIMAAFASHHEQPLAVKMGRNLVSSGNGYCFVTFPNSDHAEKVTTACLVFSKLLNHRTMSYLKISMIPVYLTMSSK